MNKLKGEVAFVAGGTTYVLRLSIDAICKLEGELDRGFSAIVAEMGNPHTVRVATARAMLWAALQESHPEVTVERAGELMIEGGGVVKVLGLLSEAVTSAFPETNKEAGANGEARPLKKAAVGIGQAS
jgi:hypothetical protein